MSKATLLADIGGTNARFALLCGGVRSAPAIVATADFATLNDALLHALSVLDAPPLEAVAMCAAGPPEGGAITLTNCPWEVSETALAAATGARRILLVNDFTALAAALPVLDATDFRHLGGDAEQYSRQPHQTRAVIGPGTGLGMSACVPAPGGNCFITGEGGHVDLAAANEEETLILARLRERFAHVSAERVLSGPGLVNLYRAMHLTDEDSTPRSGPAIAGRAAHGDPRALACVRQFSAWLGAVSGDLALTVGAHGGVYLAGGILTAWGAMFPVDAFRARFVAKGRYESYLAAIPTCLITTPYPALIGLTQLLAQSDRRAAP